MIRITNCFKMEPDIDKVSDEEWQEGAKSGKLDFRYLKARINLQDESALELGLKLRDEAANSNITCQLSALSIGDETVVNTLDTLEALGFANTCHIEGDTEFSPNQAVNGISKYILQNESQDIVICGSQSGIGSSQTVPLLVAEKLGINCITNVSALHIIDEQSIRVSHVMDGFTITEDVTLPVLLAVGDVQRTYLRVPTLKDRMNAKPLRRDHILLEEYLDMDKASDNDLELQEFEYEDVKRNPITIDEGNAEDSARAILKALEQEGVIE